VSSSKPYLAGATVRLETTGYLEDERDISSDRTAVIGPAGENEVRFASIMTTEERAFGRGGLGAVLGAKNVKAVTFGGDSAPGLEISATANDPPRGRHRGPHHERAGDGGGDGPRKRDGRVAVVLLLFSERSFAGVEGINGAAVAEKKYKKGTCSACAFACKLPTRDEARVVETEGPEFEVAMAFGSNSGVDDIVDVMESNRLCDEYGLDAIRGQHDRGVPRRRRRVRQPRTHLGSVDKIAQRDGVGDTLAEGIGRIHEDLGVGNWSVKNMDFAAHEGRLLHGQALSYAVANRGADHMYATFYSVEYPLVEEAEAMGARRVRGEGRSPRGTREPDGAQRQRRRLQVLAGLHDARALRTALRRRLRGAARGGRAGR